MSKGIVLAGALGFALVGAAGRAEAKKVYYEVNGQRFSYSTNNAAESAEAQQRIAAAKAATAAKAKAEAELASNPLVKVFGSRTQAEARDADARLRQIMSAQPRPEAKAQPEARAETKRPRREAKRPAPRAEKIAARPQPRPEKAKPPAPTAPSPAPAAQASGVKSVSYDYESGIKTIMMSDGSVHEELFDVSAVAPPAAASRTEDATGALAKAPGAARARN